MLAIGFTRASWSLAVALAALGLGFAATPSRATAFDDCRVELTRALKKHTAQHRRCAIDALADRFFDEALCFAKADKVLLRKKGALPCDDSPAGVSVAPLERGLVKKVLTVPANIAYFDTGLTVAPPSGSSATCDLAFSAEGRWSTGGLPAVGPSGFRGVFAQSAALPEARLGALIVAFENGEALEVGGRRSLSLVPGDGHGRIFLSINDLITPRFPRPERFDDNQGSLVVEIAFPASCVEADVEVPGTEEWVDSGLLVADQQPFRFTAIEGTWSNAIGAPDVGPRGYVGQQISGQLLASADFASLIARIGDRSFSPLVDPNRIGFPVAAPAGGALELGMNDLPWTFFDNRGALTLTIRFDRVLLPPR